MGVANFRKFWGRFGKFCVRGAGRGARGAWGGGGPGPLSGALVLGSGAVARPQARVPGPGRGAPEVRGISFPKRRVDFPKCGIKVSRSGGEFPQNLGQNFLK